MSDSRGTSESETTDKRKTTFQLPQYQLLKVLGKGGMGTVYRGVERASDKPVAVKLLFEHLCDDETYRKRFLRGAELSTRLSHEGIVEALDAGEHEGRYYLVMEYVEGQTLDSLLEKQGYLSESLTREIALDAARALAHAHERNMIHRDIKPANIILDQRNRARILDFGLVKPSGEVGETLTRTGHWMGTPYYMSPEQALAEGDTDIRSDLYALGATMYRAVTGDVPFDGETQMSVLTKHLNEDATPPHRIRSGISEAFSSVIMTLLKKDPADRYVSSSDLIEDLERIERGEKPVHVFPEKPAREKERTEGSDSQPTEEAPFMTRFPVLLGLPGLVLLIVIGVGSFEYFELFREKSTPHKQEAKTAEKHLEAESTEEKNSVLSGDRLQKLVRGDVQWNSNERQIQIAYDLSDPDQFHDWNYGNCFNLNHDESRQTIRLDSGTSVKYSMYLQGDITFIVQTNLQKGNIVGLSFSEREMKNGYICHLSAENRPKAVLKKWSTGDDGEISSSVLDRREGYTLPKDRNATLVMQISGPTVSVSVDGETVVSARDRTFRHLVPGFTSIASQTNINHLTVRGRPDTNWIDKQMEQ